ncbi:aminoacyl-tRNA hydrolase [Alkalihalobacillus sp. AL-G]|uniref:aminoacyl-tRNA hydrolase n=1 Tax=Alkalihalobacillus sp. AL-G TaxID=2926399 RepID=UPI00272A1B20|nr:aminoacyl-tRNA hydrolase [Alkalihalobacillus sp. AL-G]WLD95301.1 aminoacyl-tRNA hydrolase [Alkalihalobacillus sp. AL-G]
MKVIVGLGNPGAKFENTKHNVGFKVIDQLSERLSIPLNKQKFNGLFGIGNVGEHKICLLKPLTYMNRSGDSVVPLMNYYNVDVEDLLVIYDDLDLVPGKLRLRGKGSAGGHNGMKSIIQHLGTQEFKRVRIGIGRPEVGEAVPDYVLKTFRPDQRPQIDEALQRSTEACEDWVKLPFTQVMNQYNG